MQPVGLNPLSPWAPGLLSLVLYTGVVLGLLGLLLVLTRWLGEQKPDFGKSPALRMRGDSHRRGPLPLSGALLPGGRLFPHLRCRSRLDLFLGRGHGGH